MHFFFSFHTIFWFQNLILEKIQIWYEISMSCLTKQMRWTVVGCVTCDCIHHHIRLICNSSIWFFLIFSFISFSLSPLDWWFAYSFHLPVLFRFPLSRFSSFKKQKHAFALPTINANCSRFDSSVPSSCANNGTGPTSTSILKRKYRWKAKNQGLFQVLRLADSSFVVFHSSPNPPKCLSQTPNCFFFSPLKHWTLWTGRGQSSSSSFFFFLLTDDRVFLSSVFPHRQSFPVCPL